MVPIRSRPRRVLPLLVVLGALAPIVGVAVVSTRMDLPVSAFTFDPASIAGFSPFYGVLSTLGVLGWATATTVGLFCAGVLRATGRTDSPAAFFFTGGLFSLLLLLDDLFLLHEHVGPVHLGIPQNAILALYVVAAVGWTFRFRRTLRHEAPWLFLTAGGFFAMSIAVDLIPGGHDDAFQLLEDGTKWLGIVAWALYWWVVGWGAMTSAARAAHPNATARKAVTERPSR